MVDATKAIRVMLVDDSAIVRGLVSRALKDAADVVIVGTASNGKQAITMVGEYNPDIIVLDIEMPVMDGLEALPELLKLAPHAHVIMASTLTHRNAEISLRALALGASDYLTKPSAQENNATEQFFRDLKEKIRTLAATRRTQRPQPQAIPAKPAVASTQSAIVKPAAITGGAGIPLAPVKHVAAIAIASSTGGPQALQTVFTQLKDRAKRVPVFITQHMPPTFTAILAEHLGKASGMPTYEAKDGQVVEAGHIYLAPGDYHMVPERQAKGVVIRLNQNPPENFCRPAADPMLRGLAAIYGNQLLVAVLTGMGQDGAVGARSVVDAGGEVIAQDQESCVVWGMPRAVTEAKLITNALPLGGIAEYLARAVTR